MIALVANGFVLWGSRLSSFGIYKHTNSSLETINPFYVDNHQTSAIIQGWQKFEIQIRKEHIFRHQSLSALLVMTSREDRELGCSVPSPYPGSWQHTPMDCLPMFPIDCQNLNLLCQSQGLHRFTASSQMVPYLPLWNRLLKASFSLRNFPNSWPGCKTVPPNPKAPFRFCIFLYFFLIYHAKILSVVVLLQSISILDLDCMSSSIGFEYH